eukprot:3373407-Pyramimonas_sp.AAC.2
MEPYNRYVPRVGHRVMPPAYALNTHTLACTTTERTLPDPCHYTISAGRLYTRGDTAPAPSA